MTIPVINDWGGELASKLPELGAALGQVIAPRHMASVEMQQAVQKNPALLGILATVAKDNPQAMASLFGDQAASYLNGLQETPEQQLVRAKAAATTGAMSDPNVARDVGLLGATGQTSAQRRTSEANANVAEINAEQAGTIKEALGALQKSNPDLYNRLSQIGAMRQYFGTDENTEAVKTNEAGKASAETEARNRVNIIADRAQTPEGIKELWSKFDSGELSPADLGSAFEDPRTQGMKAYFDLQMKKQYEDFVLRKQAQLLQAQDARAASREAAADSRAAAREKGLDERQQARLDAERAKQEEKEKKIQEKQIAYNNVQVSSFIRRTKATRQGEKPMSKEEIQASLPLMNDLLQRNQVMKGLDPATAPQLGVVETGGLFGFGKKPSVVMVNPDGSVNSEYDPKDVKPPAEGDKAPTEDMGVVEKLFKGIKENGLSKEAVQNSPTYRNLSEAQKAELNKRLGY